MPEIGFERLAGRLHLEKDVESWGEKAARATLQDMKIRMARKKESEARYLKKHCFKTANAPKFTWFGCGPSILPLQQGVKDHDWDMTRLLLHFGADPEKKQPGTALDSREIQSSPGTRKVHRKSTRAPFEVQSVKPKAHRNPPDLGSVTRIHRSSQVGFCTDIPQVLVLCPASVI
eukprot:s1048_g9.t1